MRDGELTRDDPVIEWLLDGDPVIRWQVMRDLLDEPADDVGSRATPDGGERVGRRDASAPGARRQLAERALDGRAVGAAAPRRLRPSRGPPVRTHDD